MSPFDPNTFMQQTVDAPMETEFQLCPIGEYRAMIDDFDDKAFEQFDFTYKQGPRAGEPGSMTRFNLPWIINDDAVKASMGRDKVVVSQNLILDVKDGLLEWGKDKNVNLGRVRQAVGQNTPGAWSPSQLRGAGPAIVKVDHTTYTRKDGTEGKRAEVVRVTKLV